MSIAPRTANAPPGPTAAPYRAEDRFLGLRIRPMTRRRIDTFRRHRRGYWSLWIFVGLFVISLFGEVLCNDRPLIVKFDGEYYFPVLVDYPETRFGGFFETATNYRDPYVRDLVKEHGWALWPLIRFSYRTINYDLKVPAPSPPSPDNWLGTDDQAKDVVANIVYGFRISVAFGFTLTILSSIIGVLVGAGSGYFGGWFDLLLQRFMEIWGSVPTLFLLIILASLITPGFWTIMALLMLFAWMGLVDLVRAEFYRARGHDYVRAARALGVADWTLIVRHILPNAMISTVTMLPFILAGSVTTLTSLDFLGFGLPPGSPSLGNLLNQGKSQLSSPWLGISAFVILFVMLTLLVFIGEAVRDAFDPRKTQS